MNLFLPFPFSIYVKINDTYLCLLVDSLVLPVNLYTLCFVCSLNVDSFLKVFHRHSLTLLLTMHQFLAHSDRGNPSRTRGRFSRHFIQK